MEKLSSPHYRRESEGLAFLAAQEEGGTKNLVESLAGQRGKLAGVAGIPCPSFRVFCSLYFQGITMVLDVYEFTILEKILNFIPSDTSFAQLDITN
jgi:hypothetical protein